MKMTISSILMDNAINYTSREREASEDNYPLREIPQCISAQIMAAIALEGIANEIGDAIYAPSFLNHFERASTLMKWYTLSSFDGRTPFILGKEPLQTVQSLAPVRNRIAHPKVENFGDDIIIRSGSGQLLRDVGLDHIVQPGDHIMIGAGGLLEQFNYRSTKTSLVKAIKSIDTLRLHLSVKGLEWVPIKLKMAQ